MPETFDTPGGLVRLTATLHVGADRAVLHSIFAYTASDANASVPEVNLHCQIACPSVPVRVIVSHKARLRYMFYPIPQAIHPNIN